jgi:hypothetical protein
LTIKDRFGLAINAPNSIATWCWDRWASTPKVPNAWCYRKLYLTTWKGTVGQRNAQNQTYHSQESNFDKHWASHDRFGKFERGNIYLHFKCVNECRCDDCVMVRALLRTVYIENMWPIQLWFQCLTFIVSGKFLHQSKS